MTTTYKLVAFSRNVEIDLNGDPSDGTTDIGKHSGYGLVKYEDGNPVAMKTVEVTASSVFGAMNFASSMDAESAVLSKRSHFVLTNLALKENSFASCNSSYSSKLEFFRSYLCLIWSMEIGFSKKLAIIAKQASPVSMS